jgi:hypothetical protein
VAPDRRANSQTASRPSAASGELTWGSRPSTTSPSPRLSALVSACSRVRVSGKRSSPTVPARKNANPGEERLVPGQTGAHRLVEIQAVVDQGVVGVCPHRQGPGHQATEGPEGRPSRTWGQAHGVGEESGVQRQTGVEGPQGHVHPGDDGLPDEMDGETPQGPPTQAPRHRRQEAQADPCGPGGCQDPDHQVGGQLRPRSAHPRPREKKPETKEPQTPGQDRAGRLRTHRR